MAQSQQDVYQRLKDASDEGAAVYLENPCDAACLENFNKRLQNELGGARAEWYLDLLRLTDGLQIDNSILETADSFIETNLECRATDAKFNRFLVFGKNGNVDQYVYDSERGDQPFCVVNFFDVESVSESYPSLKALLEQLLNAEAG